MTLQQIADYAMEYLDSKGVAAEYIIKYMHLEIETDDGYLRFAYDDNVTTEAIEVLVNKHLI